MKIEDFFNQQNVIELSFFNFENAITAAYFARENLEIVKVNDNFRKFFPVLGNVSNASFPDVLTQLGVSAKQVEQFVRDINDKGWVLIPKVPINIDGNEKIYSLLSTRTSNDSFSYLNGVQGQFVDRTEEWALRREREDLLEQKIRDREVIEQKTVQLENLATRLAKYLSPQIYQSIFSDDGKAIEKHTRKNLTIFLSDIVKFTDLTDTLEPEKLAQIINSYLSEMSAIALESGGTIDKFIGDAVLVFFGDPESEGEREDALKCVEMSLRMKQRVKELQKHWKKMGVANEISIRMGIATGYCTVGNFGSDLRLDYTVLGSPVNLAARLESMAEPNTILIDENTKNLIEEDVECKEFESFIPKGFSRAIQVFKVNEFFPSKHRIQRKKLSHVGERVEINVLDSSDIHAAMKELREIQEYLEAQFKESK